MSAPVWVTAEVRRRGGADAPAGNGIGELADALSARGLGFADLVHLKLWVAPGTDPAGLRRRWLEQFPEPTQRPSLSVVVSDLAPGTALDVTAVAVEAGEHLSVYHDGGRDDGFPAGAARGDFFSVGALAGVTAGSGDVGVDPDPERQAKEAFDRLASVLEQLGARPAGIGHLFVWYRGHDVREVVNGPFLEMFPVPGDRPARHSVVRELPASTALEIEAVGSRGHRRCSYTINGTFHGGIGGVPNSLPFGTKCGPVLYSAGTYGRDAATGEIPDGLAEQCESAVEHTLSLLDAAGMDGGCVRHAYIWLRDHAAADEVVATVRRRLLGGDATVPVQVVSSALPGTNLVQIEVVAAPPARANQGAR